MLNLGNSKAMDIVGEKHSPIQSKFSILNIFLERHLYLACTRTRSFKILNKKKNRKNDENNQDLKSQRKETC